MTKYQRRIMNYLFTEARFCETWWETNQKAEDSRQALYWLPNGYFNEFLDRTEEQLLNGRDISDVPEDEKIRFLIIEMQRVLEVEETAKWC